MHSVIPHPSKQTPLGTTDAAEVDSMPLDLTRRDDAGNPIDDETFDRMVEREYAQRDALHLERSQSAARGAEEVAVVDGSGSTVLRLVMPAGTADVEDERWLIARAERIRSIAKPDLRLVS